MAYRSDHALTSPLLAKICDLLDAAPLCAAQATCKKWLERMGPSPRFWEEHCLGAWQDTFWWEWRKPILASQGNWQKVWFKLSACILPTAEEMEQILVMKGREWAFILDDIPPGWALVIMTGHFELQALEPPAHFTYGKEKFGGLRIDASLESHDVHYIVERAQVRCDSICEKCGAGNCDFMEIWGYKCVRCQPCGLSWYASRLKDDQQSDGRWSMAGKHSLAVKRAAKMVEFEDAIPQTNSDEVASLSEVPDDVVTTSIVCCFLDNLIMQLAESGLNCAGYRDALSMRSAAAAFLHQATLHGKKMDKACGMRCSIDLYDALIGSI